MVNHYYIYAVDNDFGPFFLNRSRLRIERLAIATIFRSCKLSFL